MLGLIGFNFQVCEDICFLLHNRIACTCLHLSLPYVCSQLSQVKKLHQIFVSCFFCNPDICLILMFVSFFLAMELRRLQSQKQPQTFLAVFNLSSLNFFVSLLSVFFRLLGIKRKRLDYEIFCTEGYKSLHTYKP